MNTKPTRQEIIADAMSMYDDPQGTKNGFTRSFKKMLEQLTDDELIEFWNRSRKYWD